MFNEKEFEYINGEKLEVWQTPKYQESKAKALEMIKGDYGLTEGDFWILMNKTKGGKVAYTGLIISHNGCLKINDKLAEQGNEFRSECLSEPIEFEYNGVKGLRQVYKEPMVKIVNKESEHPSAYAVGGNLYEVGEISSANLKNAYPFAMLLKRTFDRVVLKKSKLAYTGIYSEAEADEFKEPLEEKAEKVEMITEKQKRFIEKATLNLESINYLEALGKDIDQLTKSEASKLILKMREA